MATRAQYIYSLFAEAGVSPLGKGQDLPQATPGFHVPHPHASVPRKSAAEKWATRLRNTQKGIYLKKAIMQSGSPKLTPSQMMVHKTGNA